MTARERLWASDTLGGVWTLPERTYRLLWLLVSHQEAVQAADDRCPACGHRLSGEFRCALCGGAL